jgi:hypothetical protein
MRFLIGNAEPIDRLVGDVVEQVESRSTLLPSPGLKLVSEEFVKAENRPISNDDVPESVEFVTDRVGDSDLVDARSTRLQRNSANNGVNR